jgi:NAD(P)-dependent dehydrogenase (short-subunit alcohol dehydrogenase family)
MHWQELPFVVGPAHLTLEVMPMDVKDRGVLVTGASRGLGAALVAELVRHGARVVGVARERGPLEAAMKEAGGFALVGDVGDKREIHRIAGAAAALVGPIDIVIHNASTLGALPMPILAETECEDLEAVLQVNLVGPFRLTKALVGGMLVRGRGLIVHLSSDAAVNGYPRWGAYGVSKAALDHLGRVWAAELAGAGVDVLSIDPGEMDTKMHADAMPEADRATLARPAEVAARIVALIARGGFASGARIEAAS